MNPFDQFDAAPAAGNPFDQFDGPATPAVPPGDASAAVGRGIINGVPIAGPYLLAGLERAAAGARSLTKGESYDDALKHVQDFDKSTTEAHPTANTVGQFTGAGVSTLPLAAAAPVLFGASEAPLLIRAGASALSNGVIGGADSAVRGDDPVTGAALGAALGGAMPLAGAGLGKAYQAAAPFFSRPTPETGRVAAGLLGNLMTPEAIAEAQRLGPNAMLADASPSLTGLAGGVVAKPGDGRNALVDALASRQAGQSDRLLAEREANLGPALSPQQVQDMMAAKQAAMGPLYEKALDGAPPVDISPVVDQLGRRAETAVGPEARAIRQAQSWLTREAPPPQLEPEPFGPSTIPEQPPMPEPPLPASSDPMARPNRPDMPRPQTLQEFVRGLGGIQDPRGDLRSMGLNLIPGLVVNPGKGLGPDAVRQAAAEMGYLGPHIDDAMANTTINDLYDALGNHPVHSVRDEGALNAWNDYDTARSAYDQQGRPQSVPAAPPVAPASAYPELAASQRVPINDARVIQNAKQAMDDRINYEAGPLGQSSAVKSEQGIYKRARGGLNQALEQALPGYADANLGYATAAKGARSFEQGREALSNGDEWPRDLSARFDMLPLEQQALERAGARSNIEQAFGTNRNDLSALARILGDENDFNRAKVGTYFGEDARQSMVDALNREKTFANTNNRVAQNSATAERSGASALIDQSSGALIPKNATLHGMMAHALEAGARKATGTMARAASDRTRQQLGHILSLSGPELEDFVGRFSAGQAARSARAAALARLLAYPGTAIAVGARPERQQ